MQTKRISIVMIFLLFLLSSSTYLLAQQSYKSRPIKVGGIAKEEKPVSYYEEQAKLWQDKIRNDSDDAEAWHYYYKSERAKLQLQEPDLWANEKTSFYQQLSPILKRAQKYIMGEFEYHYLVGINSSGEASINALKKAYSIDPYRSEVYGSLFIHYIRQFNETQCQNLAAKMLASNIYSDANLKWNYNALESVDINGIIISNGDMDGIPKWVLQHGAGIRQDVMVVSKWLLSDSDSYREKIYSLLGIHLPALSKSDFENISLYTDYLAADILKRSESPAYISSGTPLQFFKNNEIEGKIFLVGNVLKYSDIDFDNTSVIEQNFESKYYVEYLHKNFQHHHEDEMVKSRMNLTYLPSIVLLKNHYKSTHQKEKYDHYDKLFKRIVEDSGRKEEVLNWFEQ